MTRTWSCADGLRVGCCSQGDDRFIPALCQYALTRARGGGAVPGSDLEAKLGRFEGRWEELANAAGAESEEPWLRGAAGSGVEWAL